MVTLLSMVTTMATRHHNQSASRILWKLPLKSNLPLFINGKFYALGLRSLSLNSFISSSDEKEAKRNEKSSKFLLKHPSTFWDHDLNHAPKTSQYLYTTICHPPLPPPPPSKRNKFKKKKKKITIRLST